MGSPWLRLAGLCPLGAFAVTLTLLRYAGKRIGRHSMCAQTSAATLCLPAHTNSFSAAAAGAADPAPAAHAAQAGQGTHSRPGGGGD